MSETTPEKVVRPIAKTEYLVLKGIEEGWGTVGTERAHSPGAAIKALVGKLAGVDQSGTFVAVPARSWKPVKVTPKVETTLVLEETS